MSFAFGILSYPVLEYAVHRWVMHGPWSAFAYWRLHGAHHGDPSDASRYGVPFRLVAAVACGSWLVGVPWQVVAAWLVGLALFGPVHAATHGKGPLARALPRAWVSHHAAHHYRDERCAYAVTAPWVDVLFGTSPGRSTVRAWSSDGYPGSGRVAASSPGAAAERAALEGEPATTVGYRTVVVDGRPVRVRVWRGSLAERVSDGE